MRLTAQFNNLYVGEHNSEILTVEIDRELTDKNIRLAFFTPSGKSYVSENLSVNDNKAEYPLPCRLLDCPGVLYAQILVYNGDIFMKKSRVYEYNVLPAADFHSSDEVTADGLITLGKLQDDINDIIKDLRAGIPYENGTLKKNSRVQTAQIASVARSYYDNRGTAGAYNFTYAQKTCLDSGFDPSSDTGIDCSTLIGLVLRGIPFAKSPYEYVKASAGNNNSSDGTQEEASGNKTEEDSGDFDPRNVDANDKEYPWAVNPGHYQYSVESGKAPKNVRTASQLAEWMNEKGRSILFDDTFYDVEVGDIIFWAKKKSDGAWVQPDRYRHISHVAICVNKIYTNNYDKDKIYHTGDYCYYLGNDTYSEGLYRCIEDTTGTFDGVMWEFIGKHRYRHSMIEATNCVQVLLNRTLERTYPDKVVMVARPDLGALSNGEFTGNITDGKGITNLDDLTDDCFTYLTSAITEGLPEFVRNVPKNGTGYAVEVRKTYTKSGTPYSVIQTLIDTRHNNEICVRTKYLYTVNNGVTQYMKPDDPTALWGAWNILINKYMLDKIMSANYLGQLKVDPNGDWVVEGNRIYSQVNADWAANAGVSQILNKPDLKKVATSGSYNDLEDKPEIPVPVNADWKATSGVAAIQNKPAIIDLKMGAANAIAANADFNTYINPGSYHIDGNDTYRSCSNTPYSECTVSTKTSDVYWGSGGNLYVLKIGATVVSDTSMVRLRQIFVPRRARAGEYFMRTVDVYGRSDAATAQSSWYTMLPFKKASDVINTDFNI